MPIDEQKRKKGLDIKPYIHNLFSTMMMLCFLYADVKKCNNQGTLQKKEFIFLTAPGG